MAVRDDAWQDECVRTVLLAALFVVSLATSCTRPDPQCQGKCDALTEVCVAQLGCAFLQNGNPNPFGEADSYSCIALPERCSEEQTCDCVACSGEADDPDDCLIAPLGGGCSEPVDDGPVQFVHGCE